MIERRRRERINDCLNQLKKLVLEATQKDVRHRHIHRDRHRHTRTHTHARALICDARRIKRIILATV